MVINPTGDAKIEVVRGPATLLYGSNAIGGLVNVISDTIPTTRVSGVRGGMTTDLGKRGLRSGGGRTPVVWQQHMGGARLRERPTVG